MIACVRIPEYMAQVERHANSELISIPLVFLRWVGKKERVFAASSDTEGVESGMPLSQAQAICPDALLLPVSYTRCAYTFRQLAEVMTEFSERFDMSDDFRGDLQIYLDLGRLKPLACTQLAERIVTACSDLHLKASVGIASSMFTAMVASQANGIRLVNVGDEPRFLAPMPIELLPMNRELQRHVDFQGITRLGQLAALPQKALEEAHKKHGKVMHSLASGRDDRTIKPYLLSRTERAALTFDTPIESLQYLDRYLQQELNRVAQRMERADAVTEQITLLVTLEGGAVTEKVLRLRQPLRNAIDLFRAISRALDGMTFTARVSAIEILLDLQLHDLPKQLSLFDYAESEKLSRKKVARKLAQRFGSQHNFQAIAVDLNNPLPERQYRIEPFDE